MRLLRHISALLLLALLPLGGWAEKIALPGTVTGTRFCPLDGQEGVSRIYIFSDLGDAYMQTAALANWYEYPNLSVPVASSSNMFSDLQDGGTYLVDMGGVKDTFVVFDYRRYRIAGHELTLALDCESSILSLDIEPMAYRLLSGVSRILERTFPVHYRNLAKDSTQWQQAEIEDSVQVMRPRIIDLNAKLYIPTSIELYGDPLEEQLYDLPDHLVLEETEVHPVAIGYIPVSYTVLRGDKPENENQRVTKEDGLTGSAPLNVLFRANATPGADFFLWEIKRSSETLSTRTEPETRYIFEESGKYTVSLRVWNKQDCSLDTTFQIDIKESLLAVPNVFTPNGDGVNDEFRVVYRSLSSFSMLVYNRWQHLVYESSDPSRGWNGRINGRKAPEGAYYYIIEAKGSDGVKYKKKGAVNLLRGGE